jgi:hypothetical protein
LIAFTLHPTKTNNFKNMLSSWNWVNNGVENLGKNIVQKMKFQQSMKQVGDATCIQHDHHNLSHEICSKLNCNNLKNKA